MNYRPAFTKERIRHLGNLGVCISVAVLLALGVLAGLTLSAPLAASPATAAGDLIGSNFPIAVYSGHQLGAKAVYNEVSDRFLVYWDDDRGGVHAQGQVVSSTGGFLGGSFGISPASSPECACPAAAANANQDEYLIVWQDNRTGNCDILGQRVRGDGSLNGGNVAVASFSADQRYPAIAASDSGEYLVVWQDNRSGSWDVLGQRVTAAGIPTGSVITATATAAQEQYPAVGFNSMADQYLAIWENGPAGTFNLYARWVPVSGESLGAVLTVTESATDQVRPAIACSSFSDECLAVWHSGGQDVFARRISSSGGVTGPVITIAANPTADFHTRAAYSAAGHEYLVVWYGGGGLDAFAQRVSETGELLGGQIIVSAANYTQGSPSAAYNEATNEYLVVWDDGRVSQDSAYDVWGQFVESGTIPTPTPTQTPTPGPSPTPTPFRVFLPVVLREFQVSSVPTPTATPTATPSVPDLRITYIEYFLGDDLSTEYVRIQSYAPTFVDMTGWTLSDENGNTFTFPSFALNAGAYVRVWTKAGSPTATDLYWGLGAPVWDNVHECGRLRDAAARLASEYCY